MQALIRELNGSEFREFMRLAVPDVSGMTAAEAAPVLERAHNFRTGIANMFAPPTA